MNAVEHGNKTREILARIPLEKYQIDALVIAWIKDGGLKLRSIERQPTPEEKIDHKYCLFHRTVGHSTSDCYAIRRMYHKKVRKGEIIQAAENNPLPSHKSVLTFTVIEENPEPIVVQEFEECSTESTQKEELVDGLIKSRVFKNLFESLEFGEQAQKEATKPILEVSKKYREKCSVISKAVEKMARKNLDTLTFSRKDAQIIGFSHNKPLYVEAKANGLTFRRALVDSGLLVNIMPYHTFKATGILERKLISSNVPLVTFASDSHIQKVMLMWILR